MVARGEVWWTEHPETGRRPYLILTRSEAIPVMQQVVGVPATSNIRGIPTEVPLDESDGMPMACVLTLDNVTPVRKALCTERITTLSAEKMRAVCEALKIATGC